MRRRVYFFVGSIILFSVAAATLLFVSRQETILPFVDKRTLEGDDLAGRISLRDHVTEEIAGAREALEEAKAWRIPLTPFAEDLQHAQQLFDSGDIDGAEIAAIALKAALLAIPEQESKKPKLALTFDAGAGTAPAEDLIRSLQKTRTKITFFSTGKWATQNPELAKRVIRPADDLINELGNHSFSHPHFVGANLSDEAIRAEILNTEAAFQKLGFSAKPRLRYPYGERNARTDVVVSGLGYAPIGWSVDSLGWKPETTVDQILERVTARAKPGGIILMHLGSPQDVEAFPVLVERLLEQYRFVFVSEL